MENVKSFISNNFALFFFRSCAAKNKNNDEKERNGKLYRVQFNGSGSVNEDANNDEMYNGCKNLIKYGICQY